MEPHFLINPERTGVYYSLFYFLAFLAGFVYLALDGRRRNFETIPWMLVIATAFLCFTLGCRFITFSKLEWDAVLQFKSIPYSTGRSVLGGIFLGIPGIFLAKKYFRFQLAMVDSFAMVLPMALVIERIGCFLAGCCFGTPTRLPWAIQYASHSHAFQQQERNGLLLPGSSYTLPIHPVQLYEALACCVILVLLVHLRKKIKSPGNYLLVSLALYAIVRFFLEFLRGSDGHWFSGAFTLNYIQWSIIFFLLPLFLFVRHRELHGVHRQVSKAEQDHQQHFRAAGYFVFMVLIFALIIRWVRPLDVISFQIVLLPLIFIFLRLLVKTSTVPGFRVIILTLPFLSLFLMSQKPRDGANDSTRNYTTLSFGFLKGGSDMVYGRDMDICVAPVNNYSNEYDATAFGVSHTLQKGKGKNTTFGMNVFGGRHTEDVTKLSVTQPHNTFSTLGINPYVQFNRPGYGIGVGLTLGEFAQIIPVDVAATTSVKHLTIYPSFNIRLGSLSTAFVEYRFANLFPTSFPGLTHQAALGIGIGKHRRSNIRIGTASNAGFFISPSVAIGDVVTLEGYFGAGGGIGNPYDHAHSNIAALNLHIKFYNKQTD